MGEYLQEELPQVIPPDYMEQWIFGLHLAKSNLINKQEIYNLYPIYI